MNDDAPCACTTLQLNAATLSRLRARYSGCLCLQCLGELARVEAPGAPPAASDNAIDRGLDALTTAAMPLAIVVTLLLFLQWPLRDLVQAWSTQANDLAQWLFALYVALSLRHATRHHAHLTARGDIAAASDPTSPQRSRWRAAGAALCLLPWAAFLLIAGWPEVRQAVGSGERFPGDRQPGLLHDPRGDVGAGAAGHLAGRARPLAHAASAPPRLKRRWAHSACCCSRWRWR